MFGEQEIHGCKQVTIDSKNRIVLPTFTNAEYQDKILIQSMGEELKIISKTSIDNLTKKLETLIDNSKNVNDIKEAKALLEQIYISILGQAECDKQKRIILPLEMCLIKPNNKMVMVGCKDHVKLYTLEKFERLSNQ